MLKGDECERFRIHTQIKYGEGLVSQLSLPRNLYNILHPEFLWPLWVARMGSYVFKYSWKFYPDSQP